MDIDVVASMEEYDRGGKLVKREIEQRIDAVLERTCAWSEQ